MKNTIIFLLLAGTAGSARAQKNSVLLYGNLAQFGNKTEAQNGSKSSRNEFYISPGVGYQVSDKWTVGIAASFKYISTHTVTYAPNTDTKASGLSSSAGLFTRYTLPISDLFFLYTNAEALYNIQDTRNSTSGDIHGINARITPGIGMNIKRGYALNMNLGYIFYDATSLPGGNHFSNFGTSFGQGVGISLTKNFLRHKRKEVKVAE